MATPADKLTGAPQPAAPSKDATQPQTKPAKKGKSVIDLTLDFLSSVKVGVFLLGVLIFASALGTIIIQKGTNGYNEYYLNLLPAERELYETLGFLDIYHARWFNLLLLTVSLNIILASIDYFPAAWRYLKKPVVKINDAFVKRQPWKETFTADRFSALPPERVREICEAVLRPKFFSFLPISALYRLTVTKDERSGNTTVFVERNAWNRLTAYAVHVALLTIFTGAFIGGIFGHKGLITMIPGETADTFRSPAGPNEKDQEFQLPFALRCTDIEQNLLDPKRVDPDALKAPNTLDWHTRAIIQDQKRGETPAHIHLNTPFDYRGYRFFQASFFPSVSARTITLELKNASGETREAVIGREPVDVAGVGKVRLSAFLPEITFQGGKIGSGARDAYRRPAAILEVLPSGDAKEAQEILALPPEAMEQIGRAPFLAEKTKFNGQQAVMKSFEKVSDGHVLQVQYDPGVDTIYIGCAMLIGALWLVFFFAHQRIWVLLEPQENGSLRVSVTGNTNRNRPLFEKRFLTLTAFLSGRPTPDSQPADAQSA
jgi:cytochrome c biogenesis protein